MPCSAHALNWVSPSSSPRTRHEHFTPQDAQHKHQLPLVIGNNSFLQQEPVCNSTLISHNSLFYSCTPLNTPPSSQSAFPSLLLTPLSPSRNLSSLKSPPMASSPVMALYYPQPHFSPSSLPRSTSPVPRPPSRSQQLLRETLNRDARHSSLARSLSPGPSSRTLRRRRSKAEVANSIIDRLGDSDNDSDDDDDDDKENVAWRQLRTYPTPQQRRMSRPNSPYPVAPRFERSQTSPPAAVAGAMAVRSPPTTPSKSSFRNHARTNSAQAALAVAIPRARATNNGEGPYVTPPASYSAMTRLPLHASSSESIAKARLERTLTRDRVQCTNCPRKTSTKQGSSDSLPSLAGSLSHDGRQPSIDLSGQESSPMDPWTPPPSPPFNAQTAARLCKSIEGVVHFCDIEGLGAPPHLLDDESEDNDKSARDKLHAWTTWLGWSSRKEKTRLNRPLEG